MALLAVSASVRITRSQAVAVAADETWLARGLVVLVLLGLDREFAV